MFSSIFFHSLIFLFLSFFFCDGWTECLSGKCSPQSVVHLFEKETRKGPFQSPQPRPFIEIGRNISCLSPYLLLSLVSSPWTKRPTRMKSRDLTFCRARGPFSKHYELSSKLFNSLELKFFIWLSDKCLSSPLVQVPKSRGWVSFCSPLYPFSGVLCPESVPGSVCCWNKWMNEEMSKGTDTQRDAWTVGSLSLETLGDDRAQYNLGLNQSSSSYLRVQRPLGQRLLST